MLRFYVIVVVILLLRFVFIAFTHSYGRTFDLFLELVFVDVTSNIVNVPYLLLGF